MPINSVGAVGAATPSGTATQGDATQEQLFQQIALQVGQNVVLQGQSGMSEAMQGLFEEEEPDEGDPDAEPL